MFLYFTDRISAETAVSSVLLTPLFLKSQHLIRLHPRLFKTPKEEQYCLAYLSSNVKFNNEAFFLMCSKILGQVVKRWTRLFGAFYLVCELRSYDFWQCIDNSKVDTRFWFKTWITAVHVVDFFWRWCEHKVMLRQNHHLVNWDFRENDTDKLIQIVEISGFFGLFQSLRSRILSRRVAYW